MFILNLKLSGMASEKEKVVLSTAAFWPQSAPLNFADSQLQLPEEPKCQRSILVRTLRATTRGSGRRTFADEAVFWSQVIMSCWDLYSKQKTLFCHERS